MKNTKQLTTLMTIAAAALLSACAPRGQSGSSDSASRLPGDVAANSDKAVAYCNQASDADMTAKLRVYVNPSSNTVRLDYMYVRLSSLPSTFKNNTSYISMWKWLANSAGSPYLDKTPLNFMIFNPNTGLAVTNWLTTVRWSDISSVAASLGYSDAPSFFGAMKILVDLKDSAGDYDVLKISNYDVTTNKALGELNALLPMFYANPSDYASEANGTARASVLQNLHPFKNYANQGYSSSQFATMSNSYCF